ncbi:MAG: peptidylprolyl isomerase, partial [Gammaproteobacteria bacterium]|nr:peptidylprolyl isomerase [Gammaproteobacteria bacterium]
SSQAIQEMGVRASDEVLKQEILANPQFQGEDGAFDHDRYQLLVESAGYTVEQYQAARKADMSSQQFFTALADSNFTLDYELKQHQVLEGQTRDVAYVVIPKQRFMENIDYSSAEAQQEVQEYYTANQNRFRVPEKVAVEYVLVSKADYMDVEVNDDEVMAYYQDNIAAFEGTERRRVAHILVNIDSDADATDVQAAEAKINEAKAAITAGESFEAVVTKYSEDTLSADLGGDLDWIERDMMDAAFEEAAFALENVGNVSNVVRSEFGFHLIKLLDSESAEAKPLSAVRDEIVADLKRDIAEDNYLEAKDLLAERAFEYADSLAEASAAVSKDISKTALFDKQMGIGLSEELRTEMPFINAAFSDEVLIDELNSELIELSDDRAVVVRKLEHQEEGIRPLEEVTLMIQQALTNEKASDKTSETAAKAVQQLNEGFTLDMVVSGLDTVLADLQWSQQSALTRAGTEVDSTIRDHVFTMNIDSAIQSISLPSGDMAIVKLNAINRPMENSELASTHTDKFLQFHQQSELSGYLKYLDANASITRKLSNAELVQ